jgi:creatinine amidohydrolase
VLPVAAVEQHGPHLPLGTDAVINDGIVARTLEMCRNEEFAVLVLPAQCVGHSLEHTSFPGTLDVDTATLLELWCAVARSAARAGVRKMAILNSHGGQKALVDIAAVRLRAELGMLVARANYFAFGMPPGLFSNEEIAYGIHGGEIETSLMLHLAPSLVHLDAAADFPSRAAALARAHAVLGAEKPVGIGWLSEDLNAQGVCGNAAAADASRGQRYLEHLAAQFAILLEELAAADLPR